MGMFFLSLPSGASSFLFYVFYYGFLERFEGFLDEDLFVDDLLNFVLYYPLNFRFFGFADELGVGAVTDRVDNWASVLAAATGDG